MRTSTIANYKQAAAAELSIAIGHLDACLHLWSPGSGMTPAEYRADSEAQAWRKLKDMVEAIKALHKEEGPGA